MNTITYLCSCQRSLVLIPLILYILMKTLPTDDITLSSTASPLADTPSLCSVCHQPILPIYYFCPNCGVALASAPLSTSIPRQLWIYVFSLILPSLCFLFISKWPGVKYFKSTDKKAKTIGIIAWVLLLASTVFTFWYAIYITEKIINQTMANVHADMSNFGY